MGKIAWETVEVENPKNFLFCLGFVSKGGIFTFHLGFQGCYCHVGGVPRLTPF